MKCVSFLMTKIVFTTNYSHLTKSVKSWNMCDVDFRKPEPCQKRFQTPFSTTYISLLGEKIGKIRTTTMHGETVTLKKKRNATGYKNVAGDQLN